MRKVRAKKLYNDIKPDLYENAMLLTIEIGQIKETDFDSRTFSFNQPRRMQRWRKGQENLLRYLSNSS